MRWTLQQVAESLEAAPGAGLDALARVAGVSIDSRTLRSGELFIAIHGPRHDGHDHLAGALQRGAPAAVVARAQLGRLPDALRAKCIPVADTFDALKQLARAVREKWAGKIAGVTGSVGKTTTKEILAALLGAKLRVLKSEGNFNNEYGLPLTLLRLEETDQAAVLEMGMSRRGELAPRHAHFEHRRLVRLLETKQRQRQSVLVIKIPFRLQDPQLRAQQCR